MWLAIRHAGRGVAGHCSVKTKVASYPLRNEWVLDLGTRVDMTVLEDSGIDAKEKH